MKEKRIIISGFIITIVSIVILSVILSPDKKESNEAPVENVITRNGLHWHPKIFIYINGEKQEIPVNIGILPTKHEEIHTHEDAVEGIIHLEMAGIVTKEETKLGRFFQIWGENFNSNGIFDNVNGENGTLKMLVNGKENNMFEDYLMRDGDLIEIKYE